MKRIPLYMILAICLLLLVGCQTGDSDKDETNEPSENGGSNGNTDGGTDEGEKFVLKANVIALSDKIEVEIVESDYAFGIYWVITSEETEFYAKDGSAIEKSDIKVGDTVEIVYGGQVMMSYPPQIVARKIKMK